MTVQREGDFLRTTFFDFIYRKTTLPATKISQNISLWHCICPQNISDVGDSTHVVFGDLFVFLYNFQSSCGTVFLFSATICIYAQQLMAINLTKHVLLPEVTRIGQRHTVKGAFWVLVHPGLLQGIRTP